MVALIDTNILAYRYDPRFPDKQQLATSLLRRGIEEDSVRVPHQSIVEFVAAVTHSLPTGQSLLSMHDVCLEHVWLRAREAAIKIPRRDCLL